VIHPDLFEAAIAIDLTADISQRQGILSAALPELVSLFAVGIVLLQRELLLHLWRLEDD
jgi:hypothetical protein